ncbi:DUF6443 domain-containing protein [Algoriphagus resistens]|uniref:DUF6443 domain-containing protein n=1 Tax=Algoriphagus resistens TaxID=1750590 RepID=UPI000716B411|nr:DUF6443 domain-containing protein [Algoriphagus resistens]
MKNFICLLGLLAIICSNSFGQGVTDVVIQGPSQANVGETIQFQVLFYSNGNQIAPPSGGSYFWEDGGLSGSSSSMNSLTGYFGYPGTLLIGYEYSNAGNYYFASISVTIVGDYCSNVTASAPDGSRVGPGIVQLSADAAPSGFSYVWYDTNQTTLVYSAKDFPTPTLTTSKTYYLGYKHTATNCISDLVPVKALINNYNSVKKYSARIPSTNKSTLITGGASTSYKTFDYFDALGRQSQTVLKQSTISGKDLITPAAYDQFGRQEKEYLPYARANGTESGNFRPSAISEQNSYYTSLYQTNPIGYSQKKFEPSPLNRVDKQAAPGAAWKMGSGKETKFLRRPNVTGASGDSVRIFTVNAAGYPVPGALYAANTLWVETVQDEDNKTVVEYTDNLDRVILKKVQNTAAAVYKGHGGWLCTYYVYDDLGQLRVVIPPLAVELIAKAGWTVASSTNETTSAELYFRYFYDGRGRQIKKVLPGKSVEYYLYDSQDRQVGFQDGNLRSKKQWLYTKYDGLGRAVLTGLTTSTDSMNVLQAALNTGNNNASVKANTAKIKTGTTITSAKYDGYQEYVASTSITLKDGFSMKATGNQSFTARIGTPPASGSASAWPADEGEILTVNYYDSYQFLPGMTYSAATNFAPQASIRIHGLQTGKKVKNLETGEFYTTAIFYDDDGRVIQTLGQHQVGGTVRSSTAYNFEDQPTRSLITNSLSSKYTVLRTYAYNVIGELSTVTHKVGDGAVKTLVQYTYDDLGRQTEKTFPTVASNATQKSTYNIRGWLTALGKGFDGIFTQSLSYNSTGINNGNIAQISWTGGQDATSRTYTYSYDNANRIKAATFSGDASKNFSLSAITYDGNGNIKTMKRNNQRTSTTWSIVDDLVYSYHSSGNRLSQVRDINTVLGYLSQDFKERSTTGYGYDANGNQKSNLDKQISLISYNHLNLPAEISFTAGAKLKFAYDAEGNKLTQKVYNSSGSLTKTQDYIGETVLLNGGLDYLMHEEGRFVAEDGELWGEFYVKDHLGNVRQVLRSPVSQVFLATMETQSAETEEIEFSMVSESRQTEPEHNVTEGGNKVAWLNASRGRMVGPGRTQEIYAGDSLKLQVHGKYLEDKKQKASAASFMAAGGKERLVTDLNELAVSTQRAGGANPIALLNLADILAKDLQKKEAPEAYLMYALYDQDSNRYEVGKKVLSKNAANQHEVLEENMYISKDGYMETFVVNETAEDVWFDNMMVMSVNSAIVQETHYDPWGLELKGLGFQYGGIKANKYLYNGKELLDDLNLGLYDYGARYYDPVIGRFHTIDPKTETYNSWSPYLYGANNPIRYEDTNGEGPGDKVLGFLVAVVDNASGGFTDVRQMGARFVSQGGASDYNLGQDAGDIYSITTGVGLVDGGSAAVAGGTAVTLVSGGTLTPGSGLAVAGGAAAVLEGTVLAVSGYNNLTNQKGRLNAEGNGYAPKEGLSRKPNGEPQADPKATGPHTQLGTKEGRNGNYRQAREFDQSGNPLKDIDFTDHGRPSNHPNPHQHVYKPNPSGGTPMRSKKAEPVKTDNL